MHPSSAWALPLLIVSGCLLAMSGVPGLLLAWRSSWGPRLATATTLLGSAIGLAGAALALRHDGAGALLFSSPIPGERAALACDPLTGFFLLPLFVVGALGSVYGLAYWPPAEHPRNGRRLRLCYGLLLGSITFLTLARDGVTFLIAWETMALSGYFLVITNERAPGTRDAGWLYLVYSHVGTLCLVGFFALLAHVEDGFSWSPLAAGQISPRSALALALLALVGFGIKAGAMPFHSWLPSAHASAPSHVSAVMSGVMLKAGVYGLFRASSLLPPAPPAWGALYLVIGSVSCLFGIAFALGQRDIKRVLAYSSIENIGIILLGLGLAMVGRTQGRPELVLLGLSGSLLHVWNHAMFKSLLFFGAGSVVHATGTRDLELAGGLAKRMPATAMLYLVGAVAICGLPPLNGFVSELLVYLGLARSAMTSPGIWAALPAAVLAATGAVAVACFVKVFGVAFLGVPRSAAAAKAHESPRLMLAPMAVLAVGCAALGIAPVLLAPVLERVVLAWSASSPGDQGSRLSLAQLAPLGWLSWAALALLAATGLLVAVIAAASRRSRRDHPGLATWGCGYAASSPRVQYTASSFAELVTSRFAWALRPRVRAPRITALFPTSSRFDSTLDDSVLEDALRPMAARIQVLASRVRAYQQGNLHRYVLYMAMALVFLLLFNIRLGWLLTEIFGR